MFLQLRFMARMSEFVQEVVKPPGSGVCTLLKNDDISTFDAPASTVKPARVIQRENRYTKAPDILKGRLEVDRSVVTENLLSNLSGLGRYAPGAEVRSSLKHQQCQVMGVNDVRLKSRFFHSSWHFEPYTCPRRRLDG